MPRGFNPELVSEKLDKIGNKMKKGAARGRNWKIVKDIKDQHTTVFRNKGIRINGIGSGKKKMVKIENKLREIIQSMEEDTKEPQISKAHLQEIERDHHGNSKRISNLSGYTCVQKAATTEIER